MYNPDHQSQLVPLPPQNNYNSFIFSIFWDLMRLSNKIQDVQVTSCSSQSRSPSKFRTSISRRLRSREGSLHRNRPMTWNFLNEGSRKLRQIYRTGWWFQRFLEFSVLFGEDSNFDSYFSIGLKPPPRFVG